MPQPAHEALIDLEDMLAKPMARQWNRLWAKKAKKIRRAIKNEDWTAAHELVDELDYSSIPKKYRKLAETVGNAALLLGASRISGKAKNKTEGGQRQEVLAQMLKQFDVLLTKNANEQIRKRGHSVVENARRAIAEGNEIEIRKAGGKPVLVNIGQIGSLGEEFAHLASNIHTSRLNSFGFIATALEQNITHYEVSEVLDSRTCPVCREMDGRVFTVEQGARQAMQVMDNDDPDMIQHIAPWPSQSKENISRLAQASSEDLSTMGLSLPPYHPSCRGIVSTTTSTDTTMRSMASQAATSTGKEEVTKLAKGIRSNVRAVEREVTTDLKGTLVKGESRLVGLKYRVKGEGSLARKIDDLAEVGGISHSEAAAGIKDALRYTVVADDAVYAARVDSTIAALEAKGYKVTHYRNYWAKSGTNPGPYQGINMNLRHPNGQVFELQFHTKASFNVKQNINHVLYEKARLVGTSSDEVARLTAEMIENQRKISIPVGVGTLNKGRLPAKPKPTRNNLDAVADFAEIKPLEANKLLKELAEAGVMADLTYSQALAVRTYTESVYEWVNRPLRKGTLAGDGAVYADELSSALAKMKPYKGRVYRGLNSEDVDVNALLARYKVGDVVEEKAFVSTSRDLQIPRDAFDADIMFHIESKTGRDISSLAADPDEWEVLFNMGTRFRVTEVFRDDYEIEIYLEEILL